MPCYVKKLAPHKIRHIIDVVNKTMDVSIIALNV